jgi:hypothetical protein
MSLRIFVLITTVATVVACTYTDPVRVEEDFGNSVRNMVDEQTLNPEAGKTVSSRTVPLDGERGSRVMDMYRTDVPPSRTVDSRAPMVDAAAQ